MITSEEIKKKALRKYTDYLRNVAVGTTFQPIEIPCDKKASDTIAEYQKEYNDIRSLSKEVKGYGYSIEWKTIKNRILGTQDFPSKIKFETAEDFERFLQKVKEVDVFRKNVALIKGRFPKLQCWIEKYPLKVIDNSEYWSDILKVLDYFSKNPQPQLYIRELPIEVHTKFIEQHKALIGELLDIVIKEYINTNEKEFEKRYNLRYDEPTVRMRLLDRTLAKKLFYGLDDITELIYWGDLDAQGFEILSQFRSYFGQVKSLLMDKATFDNYFEKECGTPSKINVKLNLTTEEEELYQYIKVNNYRLEQEKIPQRYVIEQLKCLLY